MDSPTVVFDVPLVDDSDDQLPPLVDDDGESSNGDDDVVEFPDVLNVDEVEIAYYPMFFVSGNCHPCKPSLFKRFILLFNSSCDSCARRFLRKQIPVDSFFL